MMTKHRMINVLALGIAGLSIVGCEHTPERLVSVPEPMASSAAESWRADSSGVALLAKGLALAMASPEIRQQLLDDMRDSPFEQHSLPVGPYLRGARGARVLHGIAAALGLPEGRVQSALGPNSADGLFLSVPRSGDRLNWDATRPIPVIGTATSIQVLARLTLAGKLSSTEGYDAAGQRVTGNVAGPEGVAYMLIGPAYQAFGLSPETTRAAATKHHGRTIASGDLHQNAVPCDPLDCGGGGAPIWYYVVLPGSQTYNDCVNAALLSPGEQVNASCRQAIAWEFRPHLIFNSDEPCNARSPYWAARDVSGSQRIQIFYAISYGRDCNNRMQTGLAHYGDSEFITLPVGETYPGSGRWVLFSVFLSAHYGASWGTDSSWGGDWNALEYYSNEIRVRPKIYASYGKHGNYRDVGSCGRGALYSDDCSYSYDYGYEFGISQGTASDLGFPNNPVHDCVGAPINNGSLDNECYWQNAQISVFTGWNAQTPGATAHAYLLGQMGF